MIRPGLPVGQPGRATACLELTADGRQIIAADQFSVWLLDLANVDD
jgi:hypothetical protein